MRLSAEERLKINDAERCPACGNIIVREQGKVIGRNFCWPNEVDTSQPGYWYPRGVWGYCYTLGRGIKTSG